MTADTDKCECGHVRDKHDDAGECTVPNCWCIYFDDEVAE